MIFLVTSRITMHIIATMEYYFGHLILIQYYAVLWRNDMKGGNKGFRKYLHQMWEKVFGTP